MALGPPRRELRELPSWGYCIERLGGDRALWDEALESLFWKLSRDAEAFSFPLRDVRTRLTFTEELRDVPVLRVFFWLEADVVQLAWVERVDDAGPFGFDN